MNKAPKIFEDWNDCSEVDCNSCEHWWDNSCDGVQEGKKRSCTSFKATRSVVIPQQIKWLKTRLNWLTGALIGLSVFQAVLLILVWRAG